MTESIGVTGESHSSDNSATDSWESTRLVGFGCLPFEIDISRPPAEWPERVKRGLEQIATVSNIEIFVMDEHDLSKDPLSTEVADGLPPDNLRQWFWVEPSGSRVSFDIHIPARLQDEFTNGRAVGAERFRVQTVYGYYGPATFVWILEELNPNKVDASGAVNLVYRFIDKELSRQNEGLRIGRVGPSPFHVEALLRPGNEDQEEIIELDRLARIGYEKVQFRYDPKRLSDLDMASEALIWALYEQLDLFYFLRRLTYIEDAQATELANATSDLVSKHSQSGAKGWSVRLFRTADDARRLGLLALQLQTDSENRKRASAQWTSTVLAQSNVVPLFESQLRDLVETDNSPTIRSATEVVKFVESARRSEFEVLVLSAATILGGLVGGIVGLAIGVGGAS